MNPKSPIPPISPLEKSARIAADIDDRLFNWLSDLDAGRNPEHSFLKSLQTIAQTLNSTSRIHRQYDRHINPPAPKSQNRKHSPNETPDYNPIHYAFGQSLRRTVKLLSSSPSNAPADASPSPPLAKPQEPLAHPSFPVTNIHQPSFAIAQPPNSNQPNSGSKQPNTDINQPSFESHQSRFQTNQTSSDNNLPTSDDNQPSSNNDQAFLSPRPSKTPHLFTHLSISPRICKQPNQQISSKPPP